MKHPMIIISIFLFQLVFLQAQPTANDPYEIDQELITLSKAKWQWMADKSIDSLDELFHENSKFVHMSGTWNKKRELEIIESGSIWYREATVHDTKVERYGNTAILWNRITLVAHVRGNDVSNEFTVTEAYQKINTDWKLINMTFSKVRDTHEIEENTNSKLSVMNLSISKWDWMADKNVVKLESLFHPQAMFIHMGANFTKEQELEVIKSGNIHYKKATIHESSINVIEDLAVILHKLTLLAVVGGNEVTNPFTVTENYLRQKNGSWKLTSMSFTKLLAPIE